MPDFNGSPALDSECGREGGEGRGGEGRGGEGKGQERVSEMEPRHILIEGAYS